MKALGSKKCIIGEGPAWNSAEQRLYVTNGFGNEICIYDIYSGRLDIRKTDIGCAAFCFDTNNRLIVSRADGVFILNPDNTVTEIYDTEKYKIKYANDMKVGPDGRIYVGTQSEKRLNISDKINGKLYSIDKNGSVKVLLDGLSLSNGLDWSPDGRLFYHTDSDTGSIREYAFRIPSGEPEFTGREIKLPGVDGLCTSADGDIYAACWGKSEIAVVDTVGFKIKKRIRVPASAPASCAFAGKSNEYLIVTTAAFGVDTEKDKNAGLTFISDVGTYGKASYLFGNMR